MTTAIATPPTKRISNIQDASRACGLSPSVLRIWELRYCWPRPRRCLNGYRTYAAHQIQELRRVAELVKTGVPIGQIIVDGMPRWPDEPSERKASRDLPCTCALPCAKHPATARLQRELIQALETRNEPAVQVLLQGAAWQLHSAEEPAAVLLPIMVAIAEARARRRPFADEAALIVRIGIRVGQLSRGLPPVYAGHPVVPLDGEVAQVEACLVALILRQHGEAVVYAPQRPADASAWIAVGEGDADGAARSYTALGGTGRMAFAGLLEKSTLAGEVAGHDS